VAVLLLGLLIGSAGCGATSLSTLSLARLRADFNRRAERPRLLALVSPS
jgi:hypothetical protein